MGKQARHERAWERGVHATSTLDEQAPLEAQKRDQLHDLEAARRPRSLRICVHPYPSVLSAPRPGMNRFLQWFNLAGVLALAVLCVLQWRMNRQLNLDLNAAEKTRQQQAARLDEQEKRLKGGASDLDGFREQLTRATTSLKETETKLAALDRQVKQLTNERDQLKTSVTNWAAAVSARDAQLKQAGTDLKKLAEDRNAAVLKFNELAAKQNELVKELERITEDRNTMVDGLNKRTREFNALVEKYNTLAKQASSSKPAP